MRLGVLTDLHWSTGVAHAGSWHNPYDFTGLPQRLAEAKEVFAAADLDAICLLGDLTHHGQPTALAEFAAELGTPEVPVFAIAGNHDANGLADIAARGGGEVSVGGVAAAGVARGGGGVAADGVARGGGGVAADGVARGGGGVAADGVARGGSEVAADGVPRGGGGVAADGVAGGGVLLADPAGVVLGGVRLAGIHVAPGGWFGARAVAPPDVDAWGDEPTVLLSHFPLLSHAQRLADRGMPYPGDLLGRAEIAVRLKARAASTVVLSGHIHARDTLADGALLQLTQAAFVEAPYECSVVEIEPDGAVTRQAHALTGAPPPNPQLPVLGPAHVRFAHDGTGWQDRPSTRIGAPT
jgi:hypothetical protein